MVRGFKIPHRDSPRPDNSGFRVRVRKVASNHKIRLQVRSIVRFSCLTRVAHPVDHDRVLDVFCLAPNKRRCTSSFDAIGRLLSYLQSASVMRVLLKCHGNLCAHACDFMSDLETLQGADLEQERLYREFKSTRKNELGITQETLAQIEQTHATQSEIG